MLFTPRSTTGIHPAISPSEPMNLGSPTTSPNASQSQYLPSFLLGDTGQMSGSAQPGLVANSRPMQMFSSHASPPSKSFQRTGQQPDHPSKRHTSPPTQSLWATANQPRQSQQSNDGWEPIPMTYGIRHSTPSGSVPHRLSSTQQFKSPIPPESPLSRTPARSLASVQSPLTANKQHGLLTPDRLVEALNTPKSSDFDRLSKECWVTVFGYPASRASFILNQFAQFGTIEKHVITNDGNWMHIKYQNKLQARCALSRNGRVFGDNIMVGVCPCTDQDVMSTEGSTRRSEIDHDTEFKSPLARNLMPKSPAPTSSQSLMNQSFSCAPPERPLAAGVSRHSSMRSLAGEYRNGHLNRTSSVRQNKESGILWKALGSMFGWS